MIPLEFVRALLASLFSHVYRRWVEREAVASHSFVTDLICGHDLRSMVHLLLLFLFGMGAFRG